MLPPFPSTDRRGPALWAGVVSNTTRYPPALLCSQGVYSPGGGYSVNPGMILMNVKNFRQAF